MEGYGKSGCRLWMTGERASVGHLVLEQVGYIVHEAETGSRGPWGDEKRRF